MTNYNYETVQQTDKAHVLHSWSRQNHITPKVMTKAQGVYFWDEHDKQYLDMSSQLVYQNIGHQHPAVLQAFREIGTYPFAAPSFATKPKSDLAARIIALAPSNMQKVFFTCGGAEANDHAIKMARMVTGRTKIFSRYRSYHGATFGAGNLTGETRRFSAEPGLSGFVKFDVPHAYHEPVSFESEEAVTHYYLKKLRQQVLYENPYAIAAIVLEPIPGSNGVIVPPTGYLEGVRAICDEFGILLICDEVMTGFGRTGKMFAVDHFNFQPDMMTFAKGVTSGYAPLGGVIVSEEIAQHFGDELLLTGLTYSGHTMCTQIGCAALQVVEDEQLVENCAAMGELLKKRLTRIASHKYVGEVRSIGLFAAVELTRDKDTKEPMLPLSLGYGVDPSGFMKRFMGLLIERGFYTYSHESSVIIAPPLVITANELNTALDLFEEALAEFESIIDAEGVVTT
ncbi:aminotransferase class III-fold pyridoxal phosphate-dependent enzyme [Lysinibacillus sp. KU-BSD001]|uniref:aminotransferase class III-fold pyridoxal phosphate-dependent enzyme n=1 Tax=Lysinibacillus sp. KU-BSD001 TaxID=3141328 RepID=UPI0036E02EBD